MRPLDAEAPVVAAHFLGQTAVFVLGEEALLFVPGAGDARRVSIHGGAVLSSAADASRIVTGGDDGKVMATDAEGKSIALATDAKHGWRLADRKDMRMSGYSARVRALDFSVGGKWLATSGSNQLILWPFQTKDGPMGKAPRLLAPTETQVEVVACHPKQEAVAVGYADGLVLLVRIDDGAEILARKGAGAPITALALSATGTALAVGTEDGSARGIDLGWS